MDDNARLVDIIGYSAAMLAIAVYLARQDFITNGIAWLTYLFYAAALILALIILSALVLIGVNVAYRRKRVRK